MLEKAHLCSLDHDMLEERLETHGAPEGPRISVVIKKKIEPQDAVLVAREACLHSRSVTVDLRTTILALPQRLIKGFHDIRNRHLWIEV